MTKQEIERILQEAKDAPYRVNMLRTVLIQVDQCIDNEVERQMFYDLVSTILDLGDRVKELEYHRLIKENIWSKSEADVEIDRLSIWRDSLLPSDGETAKPRIKWSPGMKSKGRKQPKLDD